MGELSRYIANAPASPKESFGELEGLRLLRTVTHVLSRPRACMRQAVRRAPARRALSAAPEGTRVDVANIKLTKSKGVQPSAADRGGKWAGLEGLKERVTGSLIQDTVRDMANDEEFQMTAAMLRELGTAKVTLEEKKRRRRALENVGAPDFKAFLQEHAQEGQSDAVRRSASVLQLNIGLYCNQACAHCHVESSPQRKESMSEAVAVRCLQVLDKSRGSVRTLDLTGGAPELNPQFRMIVERARRQDSELEIIDRCNLTVLTEPGQEDLPQFLADHRVRVVASLPCYSAKNVNAQRGRGVFDRSIAALRMLNAHGFGVAASGLHMDLVYNPLGAFLPPAQAALEAKYRDELRAEFGVEFSQLFTITNMPIKRFADFLHRRGELEEYMKLLVQSFNVKTTTSTMCRDTVSVNWDGAVFDCDFNQQLGLGLPRPGNNAESSEPKMTIFDMHATDDLLSTPIAFDNHCFGCTAGAGSS